MSMMHTHLLRAALPVVLAGTLGLQVARADIYTWTDASGRVNISNLAPPEGVHVTNVVHESAPTVVARNNDAARNALRDAEVQVLAERVRQLQAEVDSAKRQAPPPSPDYRAVSMPAAMPYDMNFAPPPVQYAAGVAPPSYGCDVTWSDCGLGWGTGFYPANVVFVRTPSFRRFYPVRGGNHFPAPPPMRGPGGPTGPRRR
jgi:hypothetical protein